MKRRYMAFMPILLSISFCVGWFVGERDGTKSGARQMARHILNPAFETDSFYAIMNEECGDDKSWPTMQFQCEGYEINHRCNAVGLANVRDKTGRYWYYCEGHQEIPKQIIGLYWKGE